MDIHFLPLTEFHRVYFYRLITLAILVAMGVMILFKLDETKRSDLALLAALLLPMVWRFTVEWFRVKRAQPAFIHDDELVVSTATRHRRIPLTSIRSITSKHSIFMVRRYRSWSEHVAFLQFALNTGEHVHTLVESAAFEFPAGKDTLRAVQAAVLAAKTKSIAARQQDNLRTA
ncbi:hypothetical protein [Aquipseudomonas campi]